MNRRQFLGLFGLAVGGVALEAAIPHNRVWSFPKTIVIADKPLDWDAINALTMEVVMPQIADNYYYKASPIFSAMKARRS
jgi:hypothetical protein